MTFWNVTHPLESPSMGGGSIREGSQKDLRSKDFWEEEQPAPKAWLLRLCKNPQTAQSCDVVGTTGLEPVTSRM